MAQASTRRPRAATTRSSPRTSAIALELADATLRFAFQIASGGSASCDAATLAAADRVTSLDARMIMQAAAGRIEL